MRDLPMPTLPLGGLLPAWHRAGVRAPLPAAAVPAWPAAMDGVDAAWARDAAEVAEAQRLRYQVFAEEMGARLLPPPGTPAGHDVDLFDPYCEHLLVRERAGCGRCTRI